MPNRCSWCLSDPLYIQYHDEDWGVPEHDDIRLYAKLVLDGAQAGLSWLTILKKRENYWAAFDRFRPEIVARYNEKKVAALMQDAGIVRNRAKILGAIATAKAVLEIQKEHGSLDTFLWSFVGGKPLQGVRATLKDIPTGTPESLAMSKALKARGCNFVGPTICYAFMQATGMVNDHVADCFRHKEVKKLK